MKVLVLGCGTSTGVPLINCNCNICSSTNPRNSRLRPSVLISENNLDILIDTPPDLRTQSLRFGVKNIDIVLYTHTHADHLFGIDDLRMFNFSKKNPIPIYASERAINFIKNKFDYIFEKKTLSSKPNISTNILEGSVKINGIDVTAIPVYHGDNMINGYRINDFAYITDVSEIPEASFHMLHNLKVLMIDALRYKPHKTHLTVNEAIIISRKIKPVKTYLTHMGHDIDYEAIVKLYAEYNIIPAYDGLSFNI